MSFLVGTLSGTLVAGGVYYGFSNMMQSLTDQHRRDLHKLSHKMTAPPASTVLAPLPASERVAQHPVSSLLKGRWNGQIEGLFRSASGWERGISDWSRKWLYGGPREQ